MPQQNINKSGIPFCVFSVPVFHHL